MICFGCSAKISCSEIYRKRKFGLFHGRLRWIYRLQCQKCKKTFCYFAFQQHKELFKKTLIEIKWGAEAPSRLQALRDAEEAARLQALRDAEEAARLQARLQALRDAEEAARLQALRVCRSFSSNIAPRIIT